MNEESPPTTSSAASFFALKESWPPANWHHGWDDHTDGGLVYTYAPLPKGFDAADVLRWVTGTIRYLEEISAEPTGERYRISETPCGKPERTPVHNARLLIDDLYRRVRLPPPPAIHPDTKCRILRDISTLHRLQDWLRQIVQEPEQRLTVSPATVAPFSIDLSDPKRPWLVRQKENTKELLEIDYEAAVYLSMLLRKDGIWVGSPEVFKEIGNPKLKLARIKKKIPSDILALIEFGTAKGSRLKTEAWRN